jgi:hypothetical protein
MSTLAVGGSRLRPLPLLKVSTGSPANLTVPFSGVYSTLVTHGPLSGGLTPQFELQQIVTSSSGGIGQVVAVTPTSIQLNPLAGTTTFLAGDTLTQQTGGNTGATATQVGASSVVGPFAVGEQIQSSDPGSGEVNGRGQILSVAGASIVITGPNGAPAIQGTFSSTDILTQTTGAATGATSIQSGAATPLGLLAGQTISLTYDVSNYINGRVRGNFHQDVAGVLDVFYGNDAVTMDLDFTVPICAPPQPSPFQYAFDIIIIQPFLRFTFVNGAAPSTFFRAYVSALPI